MVHDKNRFAGDLGLQEIFFLQDFFVPECPPGCLLAMATALYPPRWAIKKSVDLPRFLKNLISHQGVQDLQLKIKWLDLSKRFYTCIVRIRSSLIAFRRSKTGSAKKKQ
mmetsp:Transcript_27388/g.46473  ORF Transcript_27388/g.46473 Transcript_27388/m.46473 type:complete len:109 (+) Transcript_27388:875-1201(+)